MTDDHASAKARRVQLRTAILTPAQFGVRRSTSGRLARTRLTTEYGTADNSGNSTAPSNLSRSACAAGGGPSSHHRSTQKARPNQIHGFQYKPLPAAPKAIAIHTGTCDGESPSTTMVVLSTNTPRVLRVLQYPSTGTYSGSTRTRVHVTCTYEYRYTRTSDMTSRFAKNVSTKG